MIFDGTWVDIERVPIVLRWIGDISFMGIGVQALVENEFQGMHFDSCHNDAMCLKTGKEALKYYKFDKNSLEENLLYLGISLVVIRFFGFLAVKFLHTGQSFTQRWAT